MSKAADNKIPESGPINIMKARWLTLCVSLLFILPGLVFIVLNLVNPDIGSPLRLGIDFRGGTLLEYGFREPIAQRDLDGIRVVFDEAGYTGAIIQIQDSRLTQNNRPLEFGTPQAAEPTVMPPEVQPGVETAAPEADTQPAIEPVPPAALTDQQPEETVISSVVSIRTQQIPGNTEERLRNTLSEQFGGLTLLQKNSIGPSLANELLVNGLLALVLAYILIMGYVTYRFQFDMAVAAMVALVHDTLFVFGMFAIFGYFFATEVDSLFVTAILTVIGFSVHDTIVVFDRIRENNRLYFTKKVPFDTIVNMSVNQTLARSINTSVTALMPLVALYFWGGDTTRDFVLAIILGIIVGTYSSIFVASLLVAWWRTRQQQKPGATTTQPATA